MAYMKDSSLIDVTRYSEAIAIDMLFRYLNDNLEPSKDCRCYANPMPDEAVQSDLTSVRNDYQR